MVASTGAVSIFFDFLAKQGLTPSKVEETIRRWDGAKFRTFTEDYYQYIPYHEGNLAGDSVFRFAATTELSGLPWPCSAYECRSKRASDLARFAALYADHVLIADPLRPLPDTGMPLNYHQDFAGAIRILYLFKPLLEDGLMSFASPGINDCAHCMHNHRQIREVLKSAARRVLQPYMEHVTFEIGELPDGRTRVVVKGPEIIVPHGWISHTGTADAEDLKRRRKMTLTLNHIEYILQDVVRQNTSSLLLGANYLTNRDLDLQLVQAINGSDVARRSADLLETFSHDVPLLQGAKVANIVKLRMSEGESFALYRTAFTRALKAAGAVEKEHLRELFTDVVFPELARIDMTIRRSKRLLYGNLIGDVVALAGFLGVGLFKGVIPLTAGGALAAVGSYKAVYDMKCRVDQARKEMASVSDNSYYFLWKVGRQAHK